RVEVAAVLVVGGARALGGDHRRAERAPRRALASERRAVARLLQAAEDQAAHAERRLMRLDGVDLEALLGVVLAVLPADPIARLRDRADAAPLAIADLEHLEHDVPCRAIAVARDRAGVLVLDLRATLDQLPRRHEDAFEQVDGLETGHDDRHAVAPR